jgi:type 1 glutamine amidotransferase
MRSRAVRRAPLVLSVGAIAACGGGVAASSIRTSAQPATPPPKVLVLTETRGFRHASIPWAVDAFKRLAVGGRYRLTFLSTAASLPAALKGASAVVFLLTSGELPLSTSGKQALVGFVRHGGGLVGFHSATDTFHHWPGFISLIGAEFSHHPVPSTQGIVIEDRGNPATRALGPRFTIHEEFYVFKHDPRRQVHVLARLDTGANGPDRPLVWCRRVGVGRVFYDALGHFPQTWQDPRQVALVRGGLAWALGLSAGRAC